MEPTYSIIEEMEQYKPVHYANNWIRFANFIIDIVVYNFARLIVIFVLTVLTELLEWDLVSGLISLDPSDFFLQFSFYSLLSFSIYLISEGLTKGRTIGKLITGTCAVKLDGSPITWKDATHRSLIRMIPFEALSAFSSNGLWHDRLSKTMVVKTRGI